MQGRREASKPVILFVDDDQYILEGLERGFKAAGFATETARDVDAALTVLEHRAVDVIVSDEQMPGLCGSDLLTFVRNRFPNVLRILLTGKTTQHLAQRANVDAGVYKCLQKPCPGPVLLKVVQRGLALHGALGAAAEGEGTGAPD